MLYLDLAINKEEMLSDFQNKFPMFFRNIIYWFKKSTGQVFKYKINDKTVVVIPKISNRIFKKLDKIFKLDVTKTVCISDKLSIKKDFVDFLEERNLNILNGRWLFKYLITDVIDYVCKNASLEPETQEITILTEENNFLIYDSIKKLSNKVKNINIITHNIKSFDKLINDIHEENGLIINVTKNYFKFEF